MPCGCVWWALAACADKKAKQVGKLGHNVAISASRDFLADIKGSCAKVIGEAYSADAIADLHRAQKRALPESNGYLKPTTAWGT